MCWTPSRRTAIGIGIGSVVGLAACARTAPPIVSRESATEVLDDPVPTRAWHISSRRRAAESELGIYLDQYSVLPGEPIAVHVQGQPDTVTLEAFRIGHYDGLGGARVVRIPRVAVRPPRGASAVDAANGEVRASWPRVAEVDTTGWQPGLYLIHARSGPLRTDTALVVRSPQTEATVAVVASTATWQAYNQWGGYSVYHGPRGTFADRGFIMNSERPYDNRGIGKVHAFDIPLARVADASDVEISWMSNLDITTDPSLVDGLRAAVSAGHDEYWTVPYHNAMRSLRDAGGNLLFMGANGCYWRVRAEPTDDTAAGRIVCYKSASLDPVKNSPSTTARWRDSPDADPEISLIGQYYDAYPTAGDLQVRDPGFFLFAGTGVREGTRVPGLIGPETDRVYPIAASPKTVEVPALSETSCRGSRTWSTMSYYTHESGGGVWATGTMSWTRAMPRPSRPPGLTQASEDFVVQVTHNALKEAAKGPMGERHRTRDDLSGLGLPAHNTTGSA